MPVYEIAMTIEVSGDTEIEASTEDEAFQAAYVEILASRQNVEIVRSDIRKIGDK